MADELPDAALRLTDAKYFGDPISAAIGGGAQFNHAGLQNLDYASAGHTGFVPATRTISTTAPLSGGGDLSANRTLSIATAGAGNSGVVPASGGGTVNFLRADMTWTTLPGLVSATGTAPLVLTLVANALTGSVNVFTGTTPGVVPTSPGGLTKYLRADGTWSVPVTGGLPGLTTGRVPYVDLTPTMLIDKVGFEFDGFILKSPVGMQTAAFFGSSAAMTQGLPAPAGFIHFFTGEITGGAPQCFDLGADSTGCAYQQVFDSAGNVTVELGNGKTAGVAAAVTQRGEGVALSASLLATVALSTNVGVDVTVSGDNAIQHTGIASVVSGHSQSNYGVVGTATDGLFGNFGGVFTASAGGAAASVGIVAKAGNATASRAIVTESNWPPAAVANYAIYSGSEAQSYFAGSLSAASLDAVGTAGGVGIQVKTGARPAADAASRGVIWYVAGGAGVADTIEICRKDGADAYAWVSLI